ncbi:MAG: polysaccharide deacetylase family protein [Candidatus Dormibacteria bacterium]
MGEKPKARFTSRVLKVAISIAFFCAVSVRDALAFLAGRRRPGSGVILYYHSVAPEHRAQFGRQMDLLLRWAKPVAANRTEVCQPGERCAAVTFEDGLESVVDNALPELEARRIPVVIFAVVESAGKYPIWINAVSPLVGKQRVMSVEQLRRLNSDLVTIGSHSLTHPRLTELNQADARKEISVSRMQLECILQKEVSLFSFPYGAFTDTLVQYCRDAGYKRVFTTVPYAAFSKPEEFVSGRVVAEPTDWSLEFRLKILGAYRWLPAAFALKRTLKSGLRVLQKSGGRTGSQGERESCAADPQ